MFDASLPMAVPFNWGIWTSTLTEASPNHLKLILLGIGGLQRVNDIGVSVLFLHTGLCPPIPIALFLLNQQLSIAESEHSCHFGGRRFCAQP